MAILNKINQLFPPDNLQRFTQIYYNNKDFKVVLNDSHVCIDSSGSQTSSKKILQCVYNFRDIFNLNERIFA